MIIYSQIIVISDEDGSSSLVARYTTGTMNAIAITEEMAIIPPGFLFSSYVPTIFCAAIGITFVKSPSIEPL